MPSVSSRPTIKKKNKEKKPPYIIAQHVTVQPKEIPEKVRKVIGIDPGEFNTGIAIVYLTENKKETTTIRSKSFDEMMDNLVEFLMKNYSAAEDILAVEVSFIAVPSIVLIWQIVGMLRFLFRNIATVTPTEAAAKGLGYGRLKYPEKKKILLQKGWKGLKNGHEVAAAAVAEWALNFLLPKL